MFKEIIDFIIGVWDDFKPVVFVNQYNEAVVLRAGKYIKNWSSGSWHLRIPFIDDYHMENVMLDTMSITEVNITTFDGKTASVACEFDLRIVDIKKALIDTHDWRSNLVDITSGILSNELEDREWDEIRKKVTKNAIEKKIQHRANEMGVEISNFNFTDKALSRIYKLFNA